MRDRHGVTIVSPVATCEMVDGWGGGGPGGGAVHVIGGGEVGDQKKIQTNSLLCQ